MNEEGTTQPARRATQRNRREYHRPRRTRALNVALSNQEHAALTAAAAREHLATGAWAAQVLLAAAKGMKRPEYGEVRELLQAVIQASGQARRIGVNLNQAVAALNSGEAVPQLRWYAEAAAQAVRKLDDLAEQLARRLP